MARQFYGYITLKGGNGQVSRKVYDLGIFDSSGDEGAEFEDALGAMNQIYGALSPITAATITETGVSAVATSTPSSTGTGDLFEQALVNVYVLNEAIATEVEHVAQIYVPAPVQGIFVGAANSGPDADKIDRNDTALAQYVQQLGQHAFVSDGETIQQGSGVNGMAGGKRVTRKIPVRAT